MLLSVRRGLLRPPMKTDAQLKQDIAAELRRETSIDAAPIGVEVHNGIVTLAGHVASYSIRWIAARAAQRVSGVRALAIEMDVNLYGPSKRDNTQIAHSASNVLQCTEVVPEDAIKISVDAGRITLSGEVDWDYQRKAATDSIRSLLGATDFSNHIVIKPKVASNVGRQGPSAWSQI
jgi:osmotically-inducible protein OsmY